MDMLCILAVGDTTGSAPVKHWPVALFFFILLPNLFLLGATSKKEKKNERNQSQLIIQALIFFSSSSLFHLKQISYGSDNKSEKRSNTRVVMRVFVHTDAEGEEQKKNLLGRRKSKHTHTEQ